jgi:hypothetical protein
MPPPTVVWGRGCMRRRALNDFCLHFPDRRADRGWTWTQPVGAVARAPFDRYRSETQLSAAFPPHVHLGRAALRAQHAAHRTFGARQSCSPANIAHSRVTRDERQGPPVRSPPSSTSQYLRAPSSWRRISNPSVEVVTGAVGYRAEPCRSRGRRRLLRPRSRCRTAA